MRRSLSFASQPAIHPVVHATIPQHDDRDHRACQCRVADHPNAAPGDACVIGVNDHAVRVSQRIVCDSRRDPMAGLHVGTTIGPLHTIEHLG
jgi:hypothetical protein